MPETKESPKKSLSNIDCFKMVFPENVPDAAAVYEKLLAPMFDFSVPEQAREVTFSAETEIYCLPDMNDVLMGFGGDDRLRKRPVSRRDLQREAAIQAVVRTGVH